MEIREILKKENIGKVFYCKDLKENFEVVEAPIEFGSNEKVLDLINKDGNYLSLHYSLAFISELTFKERIVDCSKIDVDTKILVRDSLEEDWKKCYFGWFDEETNRVVALFKGSTSWSSNGGAKSWKYFKLDLSVNLEDTRVEYKEL